MTSKLALFALFYWFFLFLTCFLGGKLGVYHKSFPNTPFNYPEFASKKIEHQNKSDYKCLLFIE